MRTSLLFTMDKPIVCFSLSPVTTLTRPAVRVVLSSLAFSVFRESLGYVSPPEVVPLEIFRPPYSESGIPSVPQFRASQLVLVPATDPCFDTLALLHVHLTRASPFALVGLNPAYRPLRPDYIPIVGGEELLGIRASGAMAKEVPF
jgi:hypothetical protein